MCKNYEIIGNCRKKFTFIEIFYFKKMLKN